MYYNQQMGTVKEDTVLSSVKESLEKILSNIMQLPIEAQDAIMSELKKEIIRQRETDLKEMHAHMDELKLKIENLHKSLEFLNKN